MLINFSSYNLFGFDRGRSLLADLCSSQDFIAVQELWLPDFNLDKIINFHNDFSVIARSAMSEKIQSGFLRGRPFGGLAILARKSVINSFTIVGVDSNCRCLAAVAKLVTGHTVLIVNVYLPCSDSNQEYQTAVLDCFGFIENCLVCNNFDSVVLLGDFNFECDARYSGYRLLSTLLCDYDLKCCENLADPPIEYTYFQETMGRSSLIDHMFVNSDLFSNVLSFKCIESGINLSDHVPINCVMTFSEAVSERVTCTVSNKPCKPLNRLRWDKGNTDLYYYRTGEMLQDLSVPYELLGQCKGSDCCHQVGINNFYGALVNILTYAAQEAIPVMSVNSIKPYWSEELQQLKENSIQAHTVWADVGKPRNGVLNRLRLQAKYNYKRALKQTMLNFEWDLDDDLSQLYLRKDMNKFWRNWQSRFSKRNVKPQHIDNLTDPQLIADRFGEAFVKGSFDSYTDYSSIAELDAKLADELPGSSVFTVSDIEHALESLKNGKAAGIDGIVKEHLCYSHPAIIVYIMFLFNIMTIHSCVPDGFGTGIIVPIVKNRLGDVTGSSNYRGITLSPLLSKLFEHCILNKYSSYFFSSDLQFGFKKNLGCNHAVFVLRQCVEYFSKHGSTVYMAALDATKAFDRVNHIKLFHRLHDLGLPVYVIRLMMNWYAKIVSVVQWDNCFSSNFAIKSGVRQGGVLSPVLFNIYVDCLAEALKQSDLGCHVRGVYFGCLFYADDILLLSASVGNLQKMLDLCYRKGSELDIIFNAKKSSLFVVGKSCLLAIDSLRIGGDEIVWSENLKYLGFQFKSGKWLQPVLDLPMRRLYAAANSIYSNSRFASEMSKLHLMESFCLPLLSYGCEVLCLSKQQLSQLNVCWNNVYRKVFKLHQWESVKELQWFCERLDFTHIIDERKLLFEGANKVTDCCFTGMLCNVYSRRGICSVVLSII